MHGGRALPSVSQETLEDRDPKTEFVSLGYLPSGGPAGELGLFPLEEMVSGHRKAGCLACCRGAWVVGEGGSPGPGILPTQEGIAAETTHRALNRAAAHSAPRPPAPGSTPRAPPTDGGRAGLGRGGPVLSHPCPQRSVVGGTACPRPSGLPSVPGTSWAHHRALARAVLSAQDSLSLGAAWLALLLLVAQVSPSHCFPRQEPLSSNLPQYLASEHQTHSLDFVFVFFPH